MAADAAILAPLARERVDLKKAPVAHRVEPTVLVRDLAATSRVLACGESANPSVPISGQTKAASQPKL